MGNKTPKQAEETKKNKAFSGLGRELTEDDLSSPAAKKMLLQKIDEYDECAAKLELLEKQYHEKDKLCAVQEEKLVSSTKFDLLYSSCLTLGAAIVGLAPNIDGNAVIKYIILGLGVLLLGIAVYSKLKKSC